jgi:Family of unknown function (DUF6064)
VIAGILTACWLWIAYAFHLQRYATINWAATYVAAAFALEALLFAWIGVVRGRLEFRIRQDVTSRVGHGLLVFALAIQPALGLLAGRSWSGIELFGAAPDPTAVATLGLLLTMADRLALGLLAVPVLWCAFSGATLWAMEAPDALVLPLAASACLALAMWKTASIPRALPD